MPVDTYSTTPGENTALMPEGMTPGAVNDGVRQVQADIRALANDAGWFQYGDGSGASPIIYQTGTTYRVPSVNVTAVHHQGRRVRAVGTLTGTIYGRITGSSFAGGNTDVTAVWDSGGMQAEALAISLGLPFIGRPSGTASTNYAGLIELATNAEVQAGTDPGRGVTPGALGALLTLGAAGRVILPGGLMFQWGSSPGSTAVVFGTAFSVVYGVLATSNTNVSPRVRIVTAELVEVTGFRLGCYSVDEAQSGSNCAWLAWGTA